MSRLLGQPVHQCYVYPDFDAALERFAAAGIGPFHVLPQAGGLSLYRGEEHHLSIKVAFVYSGDTCLEIITPVGEQQSTYSEFLRRNLQGGLHHIACFSTDFAKTLAMRARSLLPPWLRARHRSGILRSPAAYAAGSRDCRSAGR